MGNVSKEKAHPSTVEKEKIQLDRIESVFNMLKDGYRREERMKYEELIGCANADAVWSIAINSVSDHVKELIQVRWMLENGEIDEKEYGLLCLEMEIKHYCKMIYGMGQFLLGIAEQGEEKKGE